MRKSAKAIGYAKRGILTKLYHY